MSDAALNPVRSLAWTRLPVLAQVLTPVLLLAGALRLMALRRFPFSMVKSATAGQPGGALLLVRDAQPRPPMHPITSRLLTAAGRVPGSRAVLEDLAAERWHGVCGQP